MKKRERFGSGYAVNAGQGIKVRYKRMQFREEGREIIIVFCIIS